MKRAILAVMFVAVTFAFTGCGEKSTEQKVQDAAKATEQKAQNAAESTEQKVDDAAKDITKKLK